MLTLTEAAARLGLSATTVHRFVSTGHLPAHRRWGRVLVARADVERLAHEREAAEAQAREAKLREALEGCVAAALWGQQARTLARHFAQRALALPADRTALDALLAEREAVRATRESDGLGR